MYPNNQNEDQQPISSTYLDQIAAPPIANKGVLGNKIIMIGGIVSILFFVVIIFTSLSNMAAAGPNNIKRLSVRLNNIQSIAESATPVIGSTRLREYNSNLKIYLTGTVSELEPVLAANNIKPKSIDKKIIALESNEETLASLEDARLNAVYDREYAREMTYQLDRLISLMQQVAKQSKSSVTKKFIDSNISNLEKSRGQFDSFNGSS